MERAIFQNLLEWKHDPDRKPLILKGVRQCGKTWLLKEFGARCYPDTAYFNLEKTAEIRARFHQNLDTDRILSELGAFRGKKIEKAETLIVLDEIQSCPEALTALKYFAEDNPEYHIVCAGSLLGVALAHPLSFPVGKVAFLTLHPLSFHEFLNANGESLMIAELERTRCGDVVSELFASRLENLLKNYYLVGGMPEAAAAWIHKKDIQAVETIQDAILESYALDMAKHAPDSDFTKLTAIWRSIPGQLAKENSKFIFSHVKKGWRSRDLEDALEWLVCAGFVHKVRKIERPCIPLSSYADDACFKLYLADTGLLRRLADVPASVIFETSGLYTHFKGAITENYVLSELINLYGTIPYFWRSDNSAEVDFVLQTKEGIIPIEVKSEKNTGGKSLSVYQKKYLPHKALRMSMKNEINSNIPLYLIWNLKNYLC